jgi:hypothetical protein
MRCCRACREVITLVVAEKGNRNVSAMPELLPWPHMPL